MVADNKAMQTERKWRYNFFLKSYISHMQKQKLVINEEHVQSHWFREMVYHLILKC